MAHGNGAAIGVEPRIGLVDTQAGGAAEDLGGETKGKRMWRSLIPGPEGCKGLPAAGKVQPGN